MKVFTADQIRAWDAYTIGHEPIASIELMERAALVFTDWFTSIYANSERSVAVFAGTGNNGGDGVAVARLLHRRFYEVKVFVCDFTGRHSADFEAQVAALPPHEAVPVVWLRDAGNLPEILPGAIVIDALFGSGLNRALQGAWTQVVDFLNNLPNEIVAIDLPSGLFADAPATGPVVEAVRTFSFQQPKRAFFFAENAGRVGEWAVGDIALHPDFAAQTGTPFYFLEKNDARRLVRPRDKFSHKGTFGHALLVAGSRGKIGAAVLAARACLRAGAGLLTVRTPACGYEIAQTAVPEALCETDADDSQWTENVEISPYSAVGVGPGLGMDARTKTALEHLLRQARTPLVLDADALNLLAQNSAWWDFLPKNSILTPHPKEFERLFGKTGDGFARNDLQRRKAQKHGVFIALKGACTAIAAPDGACWFNSTGNPGMATGGAGDVLTGILTGLLAQGYPPADAARLGVFLHGLAGDLAAARYSQPGLVAGDLVEFLGAAWQAVL